MSSVVQIAKTARTYPVTVAYGDGIGPEIMEAVLKILAEARVPLAIDTIEVGQKFYEKGVTTGIPPAAWDSIRRTKVLLKAPITTPQGGGYKSLNVTMRKSLGLYSNVRPCTSYHPFIQSMHANMNLVIIRENEEDLYAGIEYRQTQDAFQSVKIITRSGSERIMRYAFEYAVNNNRKKVTCMSKDNIMKLTDGAFHDMFTKVAKEYPQIESDHYIIDIGSARIASKPHIFDVIVTENLFGDIISDIAAEVSGSVGLAGSANIGANYAMFEAIHGSAPDIAGKDIANPSGLLHGAIMMLVHLGLNEHASTLHNAWLKTIEDGTHTVDIFNEMSKRKVGTRDFAQAVIDNLGAEPATYRPVKYAPRAEEAAQSIHAVMAKETETRTLVGVDLFVHWYGKDVNELGTLLDELSTPALKLQMISCKGLKMWPNIVTEMDVTDRFRARFLPVEKGGEVTLKSIADLLSRAAEKGIDFLKIETLYTFDGKNGFSSSQGE
ncbi:MAG: NADP-dependent isocitrate dehydrogenase [Alphaproteobacteria bacterium]|nr:NADP-dependent isocitrate dehydrogenase [Alphaproteobacteria bacterium]